MVPLDASISNQISSIIPQRKPQNGKTLLNSITSVATTIAQRVLHRRRRIQQNNRMPGQLLLTTTIVPINVLIDTGCMRTKVLSERIGHLLRQDGGKVFETNVALASGVGGISYEVQSITTLMVALLLDTPPSQYRYV